MTHLLHGYGSKLKRQGTAYFSPCFHLPGLHLGSVLLTHTPILDQHGLFAVAPPVQTAVEVNLLEMKQDIVPN